MRLPTFLREPIVQFLFVGAAIYGGHSFYLHATNPQRIVITNSDVDRINKLYTQQFGSLPSPERLTYLIDRHIRDEALYRKGLAIGLDKGDEIVRRRIIQKMEFLVEGDSDVREPSREELRRFFLENAAHYQQASRVSFAHIYFSPDSGGEANARARAEAALAKLKSGASLAVVRGDRFLDRQNYSLIDSKEAEHVFGDSDIVRDVFKFPVGRWMGPTRSGYGWHLVQLEEREGPRSPSFSQLEPELRADWRNEQQELLKNAQISRLLRDYEIIREDRVAKSP